MQCLSNKQENCSGLIYICCSCEYLMRLTHLLCKSFCLHIYIYIKIMKTDFWHLHLCFLRLCGNCIWTEQRSKARHLILDYVEHLRPVGAQLKLDASCSSWHQFTADSVPESFSSSKNNSWHWFSSCQHRLQDLIILCSRWRPCIGLNSTILAACELCLQQNWLLEMLVTRSKLILDLYVWIWI